MGLQGCNSEHGKLCHLLNGWQSQGFFSILYIRKEFYKYCTFVKPKVPRIPIFPLHSALGLPYSCHLSAKIHFLCLKLLLKVFMHQIHQYNIHFLQNQAFLLIFPILNIGRF